MCCHGSVLLGTKADIRICIFYSNPLDADVHKSLVAIKPMSMHVHRARKAYFAMPGATATRLRILKLNIGCPNPRLAVV